MIKGVGMAVKPHGLLAVALISGVVELDGVDARFAGWRISFCEDASIESVSSVSARLLLSTVYQP